MKNLYALISDNELRVIKRRLKEGLKKKKEKDGCIGGNIVYGYRRINKKIEIDEEQAEIVRFIFDSYFIDKLSSNKIAKILTEKGIITSRGKIKWNKSTILGILKNQNKYRSVTLINDNKNNIYWPVILKNEY